MMLPPHLQTPDSDDNMLFSYFALLLSGMDFSWLGSALGVIFVALCIVKVFMDIRYHPGKKSKEDDGKKDNRPGTDQ
jgi:hypothetical protein